MSRRNGDPAYNRKILRPIAAQLTVKCNDSDGLVAGPKHQFIDVNRLRYGVAALCRALQVARSG
jgi:hypothetical protein